MNDTHQDSDEDPINQGSASTSVEQASSDFTFTWLRDQFAQRKRLIRLSSTEKFARCLLATTALSKTALPWAKLARLGPTRSPAGSFRYDANVVRLFGAEGDYDGDDVPIEDAASLIQAAGIEAILNETTTPGHWRIWLPSSRAYRGSTDELRALRARWVARANGVLGGILAPESFVLSQAFYVGGIKDQPQIRVIVSEGARIDRCDDLDDGAIFKNGTSSPTVRRQPVEVYKNGKTEPPTHTEAEDVPEGLVESDDDPWLIREGRRRKAGFLCCEAKADRPTATGDRAFRFVNWVADMRASDGLILSPKGIATVLGDDFPNTTPAAIRAMQGRNLDVEVVVPDDRPRPGGGHDLVPQEELARPPQQHPQHLERTRADFDPRQRGIFTPTEQAAPVQPEPLEQENVGRAKRFHAPALPCVSEFDNVLAQFSTF